MKLLDQKPRPSGQPPEAHKKARFYNRGFVEEYCRLELARSQRYGAVFSVVVMQLDSIKGGTELSKRGLLALLRKFVEMVLQRLRDCDVAGFIKDRKILLVLPNTDYLGSLVVTAKIRASLREDFCGVAAPSVIFGQATFPQDARSYEGLLEAATQRLEQAEGSLVRRLGLEGRLFWEMVSTLTAGERVDKLSAWFEPSGENSISDSIASSIRSTIIDHIKSFSGLKGVLYIVGRDASADKGLRQELAAIDGTATRIFLIGRVAERFGSGNITCLAVADPRLEQADITLFLSELGSYGLICKEGWQHRLNIFHSADEYLVEALIRALQQEYGLRESLT